MTTPVALTRQTWDKLMSWLGTVNLPPNSLPYVERVVEKNAELVLTAG